MLRDHRDVLARCIANPLPQFQYYPSNAAGLQKYKTEYALRRFQIDDATRSAAKCACCSYVGLRKGVFTAASSDTFPPSFRQTKFVYQRPVAQPAAGGCSFYFVYQFRRQAKPGDIEVSDPVCSNCIAPMRGGKLCFTHGFIKNILFMQPFLLSSEKPSDATADFRPKQPKFSQPAGFSLGVPVPDVLKNLTFAEEALISRIQVAAAAKKLKFGDRALSGHISFFDRTANVTEVANVLPNLPANIQILEFTKQVGRAANHTFRDFRVRRHIVQAVGSSRAMAAHNLALSNPLSAEDLEAISRGPAWQAQKATVLSFERRARDTRDALKLRNEREWHSTHPWGSRYDFAQRLHRFIDTHGPFIAASNSIPQYAKDDVSSALQQWKASLIQLGYTRYAQP